MKGLGLKNLRKIIKKLDDVKETAEMKKADFSEFDDEPCITLEKGRVTEFIRERTAPWRETWIATPLRQVLAMLKQAAGTDKNGHLYPEEST
jgi:frataxin-like iron-binding protein CyaY